MKNTRAGETIQELCPKCGKHISYCTCFKLEASSKWPLSGNKPCSEDEMVARFSAMKEAGMGTVFGHAKTASGQTGPVAVNFAQDAIIGGVYKIIRLLARGKIGEVYLVQHLPLGKRCALKVIPPQQVTEVGWQRFQLEAKNSARLEHPTLVRVTDLGIHEGCLPYYAMEYLEGFNLAEMLKEHGPMPLKEVLEIFMQVCQGLETAHLQGILHRDLKPTNIMLTVTQTGKVQVKILDLGLAKLTRPDRFKQSAATLGDRPCYLSPEQQAGEEGDSRSDIYSVGCILFECLTARPPFLGLRTTVSLGHLRSDAPSLEAAVGPGKFSQTMEDVVARLLRKDPAERYQKLSELRKDLDLIAHEAEGIPYTPEPEPDPDPVQEPSDDDASEESSRPALLSQPKVLIVAGVALVLLIGVGGFSYYQLSHQPKIQTHNPEKLWPSRSKTAPANSAEEAADSDAANPDDANDNRLNEEALRGWDGRPFYKGLTVHGGKKCQRWSYHGHDMPPVFLEIEGAEDVQKIGLLGDVYLPASAKVCLFPRKALIRQPSLIAGLADGNFDEIDYQWYSLKDVEAVTPTLAKCKSIRAIRIGNSHWTSADSQASVEALNQYPSLEKLLLFTPYEATSLAKLKRLKELKELRLNLNQPDLENCLKEISGSTNLQALGASNWSLPASDLELVTACPNLERLMIGQLTGTSEQLALLAKVPGLKQLDMPALQYRSDLATDLRLLKSLETLKFLLTNDWTTAQLAQLKHDMPEINLVMYTSQGEIKQALRHP